MYLLDTNALSEIVRHPRGAVGRRVLQVGTIAIATNVVVAGELRFGARKNAKAGLVERVEDVLGLMPILALDEDVSLTYADIRAGLERRGAPIGDNDLWIAAHVLAGGMTLVTANEREFSRVPGLKVENWLISEGR